MGDAFRGLTIKIGADARPVNKAINSIVASANKAQSQMRGLQRALKFDGANTAALATRMDLVSDKMAHAAREARVISEAIEQASSESVKFSARSGLAGGNLKEVAASTKEAYAATQRLLTNYNSVDKQLNVINNDMARIVEKEKKINFSKAQREVSNLRKNLSEGGEAADKAAAEIQRLLKMAAKTGTAEFFGHAKGDGEALYDTYMKLRSAHKVFQSDLESVKKVEGYRALQTQLINYKSQLREAAREAARFRTEQLMLGTGGNLAGAISEIKKLDEATSKAISHAKAMSDAFAANPMNEDAARSKALATAAAQATLQNRLEKIRAAMKEIENDKAFDKMASQSKNAYIKAAQVEQEYEQLSMSLKEAEARAESLRSALVTPTATSGKTVSELRDMATAMKAAENRANELRAKLATLGEAHATSALVTQMHELKAEEAAVLAETSRLKASMSKLAGVARVMGTIRTMGYGLYTTLTPAITMTGRYAIEAAKDFDSAYRDMRKTVNGSEEDFEGLRQAALDFSKTHVTSADTILEIEAMGGQLGIASKNLEGFSKVVSNLDISTDIGAEDIAKYIGQLSNIMDDFDQSNPKEYQKQITSFSDALVRLGNNSAAQESSIMKVMMRIASLGNISGLTTPQLLAISTAVAATGQGCEAAGTAISKTFSNIETAVGKGGDKLEAFANVSGMSATEFAEKWNNEPVKAFTAFIGGLKKINDEGGSVDNTLASLGINSVRQKQALEGLTTTFDVLNKSLKMSQDAWDGMPTKMDDGSIEKAGDAAREAERKSEGFSGELGKMANKAKALAVELGDGATPIIKSLGDMFEGFTKTVSAMPADMKTSLVGVAAAAAALGPLAVGFGAVGSAASTFMEMIETVASSALMSKMARSLQGPSTAMRTFAGDFPKAYRAMSTFKNGALDVIGTMAKWSPAVIVAGASFGAIVHGVAEAQGRIDTFNKATDGLQEATSRAIGTMNAGKDGFDKFGESAVNSRYNLENLDEVVNEAATRNAKLVDSMNEHSEASETQIAKLNGAQAAFDKYLNKQGLTRKEQGELYAAMKLLNDEYGAGYQVIDLANGKLADESGALLTAKGSIEEYIEAKKRQIQADQLAADYQEAMEAKQKNTADVAGTMARIKNLTDKQKEFDVGSEGWNEYEGYIQDAIQYLGQLREVSGQTDATATALAERLAALGVEAGSAEDNVKNMALRSNELKASFDGLASEIGVDSEVAFSQFANSLQNAGVSMDDFAKLSEDDLVKLATTWATNGNNMKLALEEVGITTKSFEEQFTAAMQAAGGDMEALRSRATEVSGGVEQFGQDLANAGISVQQFADMGIQGFDNLYAAAGNDMGQLGATVAAFNAQGIDPKHVEITDDGGIITITEQLHTLDEAGNEVTQQGRVFRIEEDGSLTEITEELDEVEDKEATATVKAESEGFDEVAAEADETFSKVEEGADGEVTVSESGAEEAEAAVTSAYETTEAGANGEVTVTDNADEVKAHVESTYNYAQAGASGSVDIYANDYASGVIDSVRSNLASLDGSSATVTVHHQENASGGLFPRSVRAIPRHARGAAMNGIITRATLTNWGWVGEAGDEAVFHMRNAGGAIIPLSNRQHVRPFARAVAAEMGTTRSVQEIHNHYTINGLEYLPGSAVADAAERIFGEAMQQARMG